MGSWEELGLAYFTLYILEYAAMPWGIASSAAKQNGVYPVWQGVHACLKSRPQ